MCLLNVTLSQIAVIFSKSNPSVIITDITDMMDKNLKIRQKLHETVILQWKIKSDSLKLNKVIK